MPAAIPIATYRLQLTANFDFDAAAAIVPYLKTLGISHLYASPFLKARKGSTHAPKHIKFVTELPMTGVGKVDKKALKAGFWAGRERMVG